MYDGDLIKNVLNLLPNRCIKSAETSYSRSLFQRKLLMLRSALVLAALSTALVATGVSAQDRTADQRAVATHDVDFNNPAKVQTLYGRIRAAAHAVCQSDDNDGPQTANADKACESQSVHDAVADINQPQLSQLAAADDHSAHSTQLAMRSDNTHGTR